MNDTAKKHPLEGMSRAIVDELVDAVDKWGQDLWKDGKARHLAVPVGLRTVHVAVYHYDQAMVQVSSDEAGLDVTDAYKLVAKDGSQVVLIEKTFGTTDLLAFVAGANERFAAHVDAVTGVRAYVPSAELFSPKLAVAQYLPEPDSEISFALETLSPETALARFDRPELVEIVEDPSMPCGFKAVRKDRPRTQQALKPDSTLN